MLIDRLRLIMLILILPFVLTLFLYVKGYLSLKLFRVFLAALGILYVIARVRLILTKSAKESDGDKDIQVRGYSSITTRSRLYFSRLAYGSNSRFFDSLYGLKKLKTGQMRSETTTPYPVAQVIHMQRQFVSFLCESKFIKISLWLRNSQETTSA